MTVTLAVDAIGANVTAIPRGMQAAGYSTGSGPVPWTTAQWAAHPGAVRICQDPGLTDRTADVADVETGAGTLPAVAGWAKGALASWTAGTRPGQRRPAVYASASLITPVVNALNAAGIKSGVGLWVANWNLTEPQAASDITTAAGPFPVIGVQYHSGAALDYDAFSAAWLADVSGKPPSGAGPYRHVAPQVDGTSLGKIAEDRHTTTGHILAVSRGQLNAPNLAVLEAYLTLEAAMTAAGMTRPVMPTGLVYWTDNK